MTRHFDKQRRDDSRPPARNSSSNRYANERSPRPARPRPERNTGERPRSYGAPQNPSGYRPRTRYSDQPSREDQRPHQYRPSDRPSSQQGRKPYGNRQGPYRENYTDNARRPYASGPDQGPRSSHSRPAGPGRERRNFDAQRPQRYEQRDQNRRPSTDRSDNARSYENRRGPYAPRGEHRPDFSRGNQSFRSRDRDERRPDSSRGNQPFRTRGYERDARPGGGRPYRDSRPSGGQFRRNTDNPRRQSRPPTRRDSYPRPESEQRYTSRAPEEELFEGDYERFDTYDTPRRQPEQREHAERDERTTQPEERHVTRLPDGRVLKGPRPVQRKNAQFWTEVAQETDDLLPKDAPQPESRPGKAQEQPSKSTQALPQKKAASARTSGTVKTVKTVRTPPARNSSASARVRKTRATRKNAAPSEAGAPRRPSQRGFKWPTQG